jgi:hypothetical protein
MLFLFSYFCFPELILERFLLSTLGSHIIRIAIVDVMESLDGFVEVLLPDLDLRRCDGPVRRQEGVSTGILQVKLCWHTFLELLYEDCHAVNRHCITHFSFT